MFLQNAPAETFDFLVFGFGVILGVMSLFVLSLIVRFRNAKKDYKLLEEVQSEE
jgi:hypothetical protein